MIVNVLKALDAGLTAFVNELCPIPPSFDERLAAAEAEQEVWEPAARWVDDLLKTTPTDDVSADFPVGVSPEEATPASSGHSKAFLDAAAIGLREYAETQPRLKAYWLFIAEELNAM